MKLCILMHNQEFYIQIKQGGGGEERGKKTLRDGLFGVVCLHKFQLLLAGKKDERREPTKVQIL
jgi:hypothetical protein